MRPEDTFIPNEQTTIGVKELHVCLMGGGTRLSAFLGAIRAIEEQGGQVVGWAGASAGALLGSVLASGYSHERAVDLMNRTDFRKFQDFRLFGLFRNYGLYAGANLERWLDDVLESKRFADLSVPLAIVCTDIQEGEAKVFSKETTPDVKVSSAVRASVGIPGVFAVHRHGGRILVDGWLSRIDDASLFSTQQRPLVTMRLVRNPKEKAPKPKSFGVASYIRQVANILLDAVDDTRVAVDRWRRTLLIDTGHHSSINFDLTEEEKESLYRMGYEQCHKYLDLEALLADQDASE